MSLRFFDRQPIGDLMSRITNDLDSVGQLFDKGLYPAINSVFTLVITTVLMFVVSWQLAMAVILIAPLVVALMQLTSRYSGPAFAVLQERTGALNGTAEEFITGDRTVKAYHVVYHAVAKLEPLSNEAGAAGVGANCVALTATPLSSMLSNLDVALVALAGGWLSMQGDGQRRHGRVVLHLRAHVRATAQPVRPDPEHGAAGQRRRHPGVRDPRRAARHRRPAAATTSTRPTGQVEVDHVDFSYVPGVPILHDVTLVAKPGQKVGLVGPTGPARARSST